MSVPRHVAIIMDGNGRWASKRSLPRFVGHKTGAESVRAIVKASVENKIEILTLFAFSTENWERPKEEVNYLLGNLFYKALEDEIDELHKNNIQFRIMGDLSRLDGELLVKIRDAEKLTANNSGLKLVIALSYSGRWDIAYATQKISEKVISGKINLNEINEDIVAQHICLNDLPEPDLLIRTSGEQRISNFMLWQLAYTELYFTSVLWPDFREQAFIEALNEYKNRERRFGKC